ncbi:PEBP-like protein [Vararia minispora EC-137]|uniref:PEBP-like protein n=1 Tax=Vararia minispora EC-137 TaxID=1314806 RepID=A0ACB8QZP4_9AGAM|nr:PEBP-like protein [Vararia minispora EC-137]
MSLDPLSSVVSALKKEYLIPDVLPDSFEPTVLFSIAYPNGEEVMMGNILTPEQTTEEPTIDLTPMNVWSEQACEGEETLDVMYTLVMLDPDAPTRAEPIYRSFRHWVITGLKPTTKAYSEGSGTILHSKPATTPYRPPGPRPNSGIHRYTFLLFQEPPSSTGFHVPDGAPEYGATLEERRKWDASEFGNRYGLKLVGANFFRVVAPEADAA